jgi:hypothetical protein
MDEREREDRVNDFGRAAVGESKEETVSSDTWFKVWERREDFTERQAYNKHTSEYLARGDDLDMHPSPMSRPEPVGGYPTPRPGEGQDDVKGPAPNGFAGDGGGGKKGKKWKLEEVERWTMVKRICCISIHTLH